MLELGSLFRQCALQAAALFFVARMLQLVCFLQLLHLLQAQVFCLERLLFCLVS